MAILKERGLENNQARIKRLCGLKHSESSDIIIKKNIEEWQTKYSNNMKGLFYKSIVPKLRKCPWFKECLLVSIQCLY